MSKPATEIAYRLSQSAEAVCRRFLSKGRREGRYWLVGDARNTPGRSLYVRLVESPDGVGQAGKWTDAATGEHGDLLDIIGMACGHLTLHETLDEARRFLSIPVPPPAERPVSRGRKAPRGSAQAAQRLFHASKPVSGSIVASYLRKRAIADLRGCDALRFHPHCFYRAADGDPPDTKPALPAMIAAVTDLDGAVTGVHRTWLDQDRAEKASIANPRRAMGQLLGNGVRFGRSGDTVIAGEGIETVLSLRQIMPRLPMVAALSAAHLAAIRFPANLRRLYVARDADAAGDEAIATLMRRTVEAGIELFVLSPLLDDFNADLRTVGADRLRATLRGQLMPADVQRFLGSPQ